MFISPMPDMLARGLDKKFKFKKDDAHFAMEFTRGWDGYTRFFNRQYAMLPIGFLEPAMKTMKDYAEYKGEIAYFAFKDWRNFGECLYKMPENLNGIKLYDYQQEAVFAALRSKIGILNISVGGGKTEIGAELARWLDRKTLWLTHKKELLTQTYNRFAERLGRENIGIIQGDKIDLDKPITIAMIPTLARNLEDYKKFLNSIAVIMVDECHHAKAKTWNDVLRWCPAGYRFGFSGSIIDKPETMWINSQLGYEVIKITSKDLMEKGKLSIPNVKIHHVDNPLVMGEWFEVENDYIVNNIERNEIIAEICEKDEGFVVIIVKKIEHGKNLQERIPNSVFINGTLGDKERESIMLSARCGGLKVLIGTVINEGVDLPNIDTIILAGGGKSEEGVIQSAGRVLRKCENKNKAIHDFYDTGKYIESHSKNRISVYRSYANVEHV